MKNPRFFRFGSEKNNQLLDELIDNYWYVYIEPKLQDFFSYANTELEGDEKKTECDFILRLLQFAKVSTLVDGNKFSDQDYAALVEQAYPLESDKFKYSYRTYRRLLSGTLKEGDGILLHLRTVDPVVPLAELNVRVRTRMQARETVFFQNEEQYTADSRLLLRPMETG